MSSTIDANPKLTSSATSIGPGMLNVSTESERSGMHHDAERAKVKLTPKA